MSTKRIIAAAVAALAFSFMAKAQTNVQVFYDFGKDRQYMTTTFEMFKGDKFGDTFFFIDHYYTQKDQRPDVASAINGSYFEIERGINFWQESDLKDLSGHVEYDGTTWGQGTWCFGAKYFLHSQDFSNMLTLYAMFETFQGFGKADIPVKFTAVWSMADLFGVKGLTFKGFADLWGNNTLWGLGDETKFTFLTEPQLWMNLGSVFDNHLDIGCELEISCNFAGNKGFMLNPCAGIRWAF
ncbi:MAG: DUF5020 family protein [Bacteroidales bacterium]|jgi:hypothetical protein|nr:DUF5020 family protein [Bacteroidales bacterium]MCR5463230.1 DUF5020 family protein [Bacteroidales bacterium]